MLNAETNHNFRMNLQYLGLKAKGIPAINKTLLHGGKCTEQVDGIPYTGKVILLVNKGGLRNKILNFENKELFKNDVLPVLTKCLSGVDLKFTGKVELHYREGLLTKFNLPA